MKQSFAWWCFAPHAESAEALLQTAAAIGYAGVDLVDEAHWPLVQHHGLAIAAIVGHASLTDGLNRVENHDRIEREITARLEQAVRWSIPNLICFSGNRGGLSDAAGAAATAAGLARVARAAEDAGVTLVLELLNSKVDHPDYQCDRTAWGAAVCQMVNSPRVKLLYDVYHMQIMEGDLVRTIGSNSALFGHYHTAGNPGRGQIDPGQEINYAPIVRAIAASGYQGYIAHEFLPATDVQTALAHAYQVCVTALDAASGV